MLEKRVESGWNAALAFVGRQLYVPTTSVIDRLIDYDPFPLRSAPLNVVRSS